MAEPVQTAVSASLGPGAPAGEIDAQESAMGLYLPPWPEPQTIISVPVHTASCPVRAAAAPVVEVGETVSVAGSYWKPVFNGTSWDPPHTIILLPVQTAV